MQRESRDYQFSITHLIAHDPADNDTEAKAGKSRAVDITKLLAGEPEVRTPIGQNAATNAKTDTRRQNRHKSCKQQALSVRSDCFIADLNVAHRINWELPWGGCS